MVFIDITPGSWFCSGNAGQKGWSTFSSRSYSTLARVMGNHPPPDGKLTRRPQKKTQKNNILLQKWKQHHFKQFFSGFEKKMKNLWKKYDIWVRPQFMKDPTRKQDVVWGKGMNNSFTRA